MHTTKFYLKTFVYMRDDIVQIKDTWGLTISYRLGRRFPNCAPRDMLLFQLMCTNYSFKKQLSCYDTQLFSCL